MTNRHALSDEKRALIQPYVPPHKGRHGGDEHKFIDAILWLGTTGSPWRDLPGSMGHWNHVYQRFAYWCNKGHFESIFKALARPDMEEIMHTKRHQLTKFVVNFAFSLIMNPIDSQNAHSINNEKPLSSYA